MVDPSALNPFESPAVLHLEDSDNATIVRAAGYGSFGQPASFTRDDSGRVRSITIAGLDHRQWDDYPAHTGVGQHHTEPEPR